MALIALLVVVFLCVGYCIWAIDELKGGKK